MSVHMEMRSAELQELYKPLVEWIHEMLHEGKMTPQELLGVLMIGISYVQEVSKGDQDVGSNWTTGIS